MKTFQCECGQLLFFENSVCTLCQKELGFLPGLLTLASLTPADNGLYRAHPPEAKDQFYKKCQNYSEQNVCNWMVSADLSSEVFCASCRLNTVIPDLTLPNNLQLWTLIEVAKRRFAYTALKLKLPLASRADDPQKGLGFQFLGDITNPDGSVVRAITAHDNGLITLNIEEADDAVREKNRINLREPYRTLLGHFRHESGHYYWDRLVDQSPFLEPFRALFGDERRSYDEAMQAYYQNGAPADWQNSYISAYATMHPWEDWAESWAHFLHIQDALEIAAHYGIVGRKYSIDPKVKPPEPGSFEESMEKWAELTLMLNSMNRSMGLRDLYPFILSKPVIEKLRFIASVIAGSPAS